jgi:hypothetical protein
MVAQFLSDPPTDEAVIVDDKNFKGHVLYSAIFMPLGKKLPWVKNRFVQGSFRSRVHRRQVPTRVESGDLTQWRGNFTVSVKTPNFLREFPIVTAVTI